MTALKGRAIEDFMRSGAGTVRAVLVYGPDQGLARERSDALARRIVPDFKDPFNYIELSDADLKSEPGRLADEAAALSFAGGERVVRYTAPGEGAPPAVALLIGLLDSGRLNANALVIVEGGDLGPRSALRQAFEKARRAVALPCYVDGPQAARALAVAMAREEDLKFDDDALDLIVTLIGEDRAMSRAELGKLILFKGLKSQRSGPGTITRADVRANLVDGAGDALDDIADAAADGAGAALSRALWRSAAAGASPISALRALWRSLARLKEAQGSIAAGSSPAEAMKKLRPPVFFGEERAFEARLRMWPPAHLDDALDLILSAEFDAKTTGAPQREIVERAALRVALMVQRN